MRLKDLLEEQKLIQEMPMIKHGTIGKFDSEKTYQYFDTLDMAKDGTSWHKASDRKLVKNPVHINKLEHMFARTKHNFSIFAIDNNNAKVALKGRILNDDRDEVEQFFGEEKTSEIYDDYTNSITLLVAENSADKSDEIMAPWLYAHKLWHFIDEQPSVPSDIMKLKKELKSFIVDYAHRQFGSFDSGVQQLIGTSAAFRNKEISASFEVSNELFCQFINTGGKVTLDIKNSILNKEQANQLKIETESKLEKYFDDILTKLNGNILFLTA
jgi:hypothetical protein